jgi:hypothetical protein
VKIHFAFCFLSAFSAVTTSSVCRADEWTLGTSDFRNDTVLLHGLDEHGAAVTTIPSQNAHTVGLDQFVEISRVIPITQRASLFILRLRDGDLLAGEPVSLQADSVVWREDVVGNMTVPLSDAISFYRPDLAQARVPRAAPDDSVRLANGDTVHGVLSELGGMAVSIQPAAGGDATSIPFGSVNSVQFASLGESATTSRSAGVAPVQAAFRIHLIDDSILTAASVRGDDWTMHLTFNQGPARDVPLSAIESIEQINGPVIWLSSIPPEENVQTPFLESGFPARFDRSVLGGPIQFGDRVYTHGIGVHAYSRLSWPIDPAYTHFRSQYAVDGDEPYADLTVQIRLDGQIVQARKGLRAGEITSVVELDLKGKHTLTLEAIDEQNEGVQARLNWIEPAFVR